MNNILLHRGLTLSYDSSNEELPYQFCIINTANQWERVDNSIVINPDPDLYDGVYRSFSNYNKSGEYASMHITIRGYEKFKLYIRSYAESTYDYVMVSQLDKLITGNTEYTNNSLVKAHTRGNQNNGTTIDSYTLVEFNDIPTGIHTITIVYRKDLIVNSNDDRGYVLIPKNQ